MSILRNPLPGNVYVVSKHSLSKNFNRLLKYTNWGQKKVRFSLVVIDESHQGKADQNVQQDEAKCLKEFTLKSLTKKVRDSNPHSYTKIFKISV